ncbi:MAG TPA: GGDEF domain-containing protein, partial [Chondromyces sp.]|nr:GGDEF domain-containing protein [Chondromyces sp.]
NEYLAYHDYLTSLPNRRFLEERLEKQIISSRLLNEQFAVFYLDLDRFKYINDSLGHLIGDQLLKKVANRLKICVRKQDFVAHIAGDEFVLFLSNITKESAITRAKTLIRSLERPFYILNDELHITASIGISMYPEDGDERTVLMRNADAALYRAKALGKNNVQVYS